MMKSVAVFALIVQVCTATFVDSMPKVTTIYPSPNRQPEPQYGHTADGLIRLPHTMPPQQPGPPSQYSPFPTPVQQPGPPGFYMGSPTPFGQSFGIPGMENMMLTLIFGPAPQGFNPFPQQPSPPFMGTITSHGKNGYTVDYSPPNMRSNDFLCGTTGQPQIDMSELEKLPRYDNVVPIGMQLLEERQREREQQMLMESNLERERQQKQQKETESNKKPEVSPTGFAPAVVLGGPPRPVTHQQLVTPGYRQGMVMPNGNTGIVPPRIY